MYAFSVNKDLPSFRAPFNQFFHMHQLLGPEFTEVVGPNNDRLYSTAWLDLGTEPIVLSECARHRYYVFQICDMYTFNLEYIGARTTGYQAAKYLFAGPDWDESTPEGIDGVRRTEGRFLFLLGRTAVAGTANTPAVNTLQDQYRLTPLSAYLGQTAPDPAPRQEAYNFSAVKDGDGEPLDASKHNYVIHFATPSPVRAFWSVTMYKLPAPLFVANPIKCYSISDRTPGFEPNEDGSVAIYAQHESPGPDKEANWLPAPDGSFALSLRIYWPEKDVLDGKWQPAAIQKT